MYRNNKNISVKGNWGIGNFLGLFLGIVLCVFFAACDEPEKERDPRPGFGSETIADKNYIENSAIAAETLPEATGGDMPLSYSLAPLPDGLTFDSGTRVLSGTPTSAASTTVTYTATDADGDNATLTFSIMVAMDTPPSFGSATVAAQSYTQGRTIDPLQLPQASSGNAPLTYSLSPVPAGLMFDSGTRMLTGTPSATLSSTDLTYTVRDADGDTDTITFSVQVAANLVPSFGSERINDQVYMQGIVIGSIILPEATGGDMPLSYSLAPLPNGLTFDSGTRELSGTPTATGSTPMTYTATDADGDEATLTFSIEVAADLMLSFGSAMIDDKNYIQNTAIAAETLPAATGGNGTLTYSLTPNSPATMLPAGLTFDSSTRELRGTPTAAGTTMVTYTATDADGDTATLTFSIEVAADLMPSFGGPVDNQTYTQNTAITTLILPRASGGDGTLTYSLTPNSPATMLPAGLTFNSSTRELSGTPTAAGTTMVTYTATDADMDTATLTFSIEVEADLMPSFGSQMINDQDYLQGIVIGSIILPEATGGDMPLSYSLAPLPDGLMFDSVTRELTGAPTAAGTTMVTYTATDADMDEATLTFSIVVGMPVSGSGICDRTQQVRDGIIAAISGTPACEAVTASQLEGISELSLQQRSIASLQTNDFEGLSNLSILRLWENSISSLPEDVFDGLTSLTILLLGDNDLTALPEDIFDGLTNLGELNLGDNDLTTLPEDVFDGLTSLTTLSLNLNDLTTPPEELFDGLSSLQSLNITGNDLTALPEELFDGLTSLTALSLGSNSRLTAPHENLFEGLTSLTRLILNGNNMANPHEDLFDGLTSLQTLDLRNNMITTLHADLFDGLTSLMYLDLRGNASLVTPAVCSSAGVMCTLP